MGLWGSPHSPPTIATMRACAAACRATAHRKMLACLAVCARARSHGTPTHSCGAAVGRTWASRAPSVCAGRTRAPRRRDRLLCAAASLDASFSPDHPGAEATSGYGEKGGGDDIHDDNDDHLCDDNTTEGDTSTAPFVPPRQQHPPPGFERNVQTALDEPPAAWAGGTPPRRKHASTPTEAGVVERRSRESILHARIA